MWTRLLTHKRFPLFAPFIGLGFLTLVAFGFWHLAAARLTQALSENNISWQSHHQSGFPARITVRLQGAEWRDRTRLWRNDEMSLTTMPFNPRHAIADFSGAHYWRADGHEMTLAHQGNLMSVVGDEDGPLRISFEAKRPTANGVWQDRRITAKAEQLTAHMRRQETRHQISARIEKLTVDNAHAPLERLDIAFTAPVGFFETGPAIGQLLVLDRMTVSQAGVSLIARGRLKLRPAGRLDGTLDLDIVNLAGFVDRMVAVGLVAPHEKRKLLLLSGLGAALGGDTQDRLSVPLTFAQGRIRLGPIDIGAAPSWQ